MNEVIPDPQGDMASVPAVLLVGGLGTRLRAVVASKPKPLAQVGQKPFLELLVRQLAHQGVRRLVMCTGYLADQVKEEFGDGSSWNMKIEYSEESSPLGTAGAIKLTERHLGTASDFFVTNGDSFLEVDFRRLLHLHRERRALATMATIKVENAAQYGLVELDSNGRVTRFREKTGEARGGTINAGVYAFNRSIFSYIPGGPSSLEKDVFPRILDRGIYASEQTGLFIDIGTPSDYARAQELYGRINAVAAGEPPRQGRIQPTSDPGESL